MISLKANQIEYILENICDMIKLSHMDLSKNKIKILPRKMGRLKNLKDLCIDTNNIRLVSNEFANFADLKLRVIE